MRSTAAASRKAKLHAPAPCALQACLSPLLNIPLPRCLSCTCLQSQFIVVSLKEGMFNNANVVFRTRFVVSVAARIMQMAGLVDLQPYECFGRLTLLHASEGRSLCVWCAGGRVVGHANGEQCRWRQ